MDQQYVHGHHGSVVKSHAARSGADSASFVLGRLDPEKHLLDIGCGPGSITLDLARLVGSVVGLDASHQAIAVASAADVSREIDGEVDWVVGSAERLPFADGTFDIVFAHQLLQHVSDPVAVLREARRVLRPGGLVAVRDADYGTMVHAPHEPRLDRWLKLYSEVARTVGGEPNAGRHLPSWVAAAGFTQLEISTSTWTYAEPERVEAWRDLWVSRLLEARLGDLAIRFELTDREELEDLADGWRTWAASATPYYAFLHGEVIARA